MTDVSPYNLVQETLVRDEWYSWRLIVTCCLFNRTHGRQVRPMVDRFFELVPTPAAVLAANERTSEAVLALLRPLGFQTKRWAAIKRMSKDVICGRPLNECYGVGQYALDAIEIFVHGRTDLEPSDHWLKPYIEWRRQNAVQHAGSSAPETGSEGRSEQA